MAFGAGTRLDSERSRANVGVCGAREGEGGGAGQCWFPLIVWCQRLRWREVFMTSMEDMASDWDVEGIVGAFLRILLVGIGEAACN